MPILLIDIDGTICPALNINFGQITQEEYAELVKKSDHNNLYPKVKDFLVDKASKNTYEFIFPTGRKASLFQDFSEKQLSFLPKKSIIYYPENLGYAIKSIYVNWKISVILDIISKTKKIVKIYEDDLDILNGICQINIKRTSHIELYKALNGNISFFHLK